MSAPTRLGRYPVRRRIGSGAFATVWLAHDEQLDSPVAIKVLADNWTEDHHIRQRFVEEGRFLRKVESPHVVSVYDAGELDDGRPYLVMSYADQGTLADRLEGPGLDRDQSLLVITQVGLGLTALHHRGVLHRDVKPANVLFRTVDHGRGSRVVAMLGDLGLGKAMDMSSRLTMAAGTPTYVAPEQARGERLDARADQFSLAALAYVLLSGRAPYDHPSLAAAAEDPTPPLPMGVDNEAAEAVVLRALSKDREQRFDEISDFTGALVEALGPPAEPKSLPWVAADPEVTHDTRRPTGTAEEVEQPEARGPRRGWRVLGALALVLGLGAGWVAQGWAAQRAVVSERTLDDVTGELSVTVPEEWASHVAPEQWRPPGDTPDDQPGEKATYPSLAAGAAPGWNTDGDPAPGVFVGILEGTTLPSQVPGHPDCTTERSTIRNQQDGDESMTVVFSGCPGPDVTVERVVRITETHLLWIQVRSEDGTTANSVLESVTVRGPWR